MLKMAIIAGFLGQTKDRFHEYNEPLNLEGKFKSLSEIQGYDALEIVYPYEAQDPDQVKNLMKKYHVSISAVNVNVKKDPDFANGGVSSSVPEIREKAVRFIKESKDFAVKIGANKVTCCPLGDGYEFAFQCDFAEVYKNLRKSFNESAAYRPEIPLFIEYKPSETRGHCFIDTAAKTLLFLDTLDVGNTGVTVDFGHSLYGNENPSEAVTLINNTSHPLYVHINDNDAKWDWDYFCGSKHILEYAEFLYTLKKIGYNDYLTSDTSPTRFSIKDMFEANSRISNKLWNLFDRIDTNRLEELMHQNNYLETWKFIEENILGMT